jgi:putative oxidoreductase
MKQAYQSKLSLASAYQILIKFGELLQPLILLAFRVYWGWQLYETGKGKLTNHSNVVEFFTSLGIPAPDLNAWFVGGLECFGGLLLLIGLLSRPIAFMMAINMTVAYLAVEEDRIKFLNIFSDPEPFIMADPFFFLLMSLLVLAFGPGRISVDSVLKNIWFSKGPVEKQKQSFCF